MSKDFEKFITTICLCTGILALAIGINFNEDIAAKIIIFLIGFGNIYKVVYDLSAKNDKKDPK